MALAPRDFTVSGLEGHRIFDDDNDRMTLDRGERGEDTITGRAVRDHRLLAASHGCDLEP